MKNTQANRIKMISKAAKKLKPKMIKKDVSAKLM